MVVCLWHVPAVYNPEFGWYVSPHWGRRISEVLRICTVVFFETSFFGYENLPVGYRSLFQGNKISLVGIC